MQSHHIVNFHAKRKIISACSTLRNKVSRIIDKEISPSQDCQNLPDDLQQKASDMDELVRLIKAKIMTPMTQREQI